jgi:NitT/TauT family transport system substrate-binding protein
MPRVVGRLLAGALFSLWALNAAAAPPRVVLAVDGVAETRNLPVLVAQQLGYFRDEGLTVTLVDSPASPSPAELVKDGRADGAVAFYHHTFMSQVDDRMVTEDVATLGVTPGLKLMAAVRLRDKVKGPADLKGLRIYTGGANSGKTTAMNWLAERAGLGAHGYVALQPTTAKDMAEALRDGRADAIMAHEPDAAFYARSGAAFALADLASPEGTRAALGALYPSTSLYMPRAYVAAHPEVVQHLVNACLRALAFINGHDAAAILAILPPKTAAKDRAGFLATLAEDKKMFATDGFTPPDGARRELAAMSAISPKYRTVDLAQTYTDAFVRRARAEAAHR